MFETEDLVLRKNEKNFVLCLLEVARRASRFGMSAPMLIQMEEQIEEEIREELDLPPEEIPLPKPQRKVCDFKNLDQMVQYLVSRCTCPVQFSMFKVSEGKYRVGESNTLIFVRILRNHVMVRVGGGWDTLEHYLDKHDPCRCTSLSHKQTLKLGNPQKQAAPVHEVKARVTPRSDNPNKSQTTLIVSRSQSPLPPVEWRTYTTVRSRIHSSSDSPERSDRTAGLRTAHVLTNHKRTIPTRAPERPATPSRRQRFVEESQAGQQLLLPQSERDRHRLSTSSLGSQLTGSEEENSSPSAISSEIQRGRQMGESPVLSLKEPRIKDAHFGETHTVQAKAQSTAEGDNIQQIRKSVQQSTNPQESRPKTPSRCIRPPSPTKHIHLFHNQHGKGAEQNLKIHSDNFTRSPSTKQPSQPAKHETITRNSVKSTPVFNRPSTPSRSYLSEPQYRERGKVVGRENTTSHDELKSTSVQAYGQQHRNARASMSTPTIQLNKNGVAQLEDKDSNQTWTVQSRQANSSLEALDISDNVKRDCMYTPLPIDPEQEKELYQSLEDEILSNIKALEGDSDENNNLENRLRDFTPERSVASDTAVRDFNVLGSSISTVSSLTNTLKTPGGEAEVPRSGVYINTKWPSGANYDDVIMELTKGRMKLNRVDVENWISRIPPKGTVEHFTERNLPHRNKTHEKKEPSGTQKNTVKKRMSFVEAKGSNLKQLPSQRARHLAMEIKKKASETLPVPQTVSISSPKEVAGLEKSNLLQGSKLKRSLKKPERVPSIYKLKLRPKIRPRQDNRPEKKPSRIPTPIAFRQVQNRTSAKHPGRSQQSQLAKRAGVQSLNMSQCTAASTEDLSSDDEAWSSEISASPQATNSLKQESRGVNNPGKTDEDEESWV
ncbi:hypothetical protein FKM82_025562 [Ascaphus truei]